MIDPIPFPQAQAYSDLGPLGTLGKALSPQPASLGNLQQQMAQPTTMMPTPTTAPSGSIGDYSRAISGIESGGNYSAVGPATKSGDKAYGKYQVMGANIPSWTKDALGYSMTPDQFLNSPAAQDAVFKYKFGQYADKYGATGAAKAWFGGEKGMNNPNASDVYGTTVQSYADKFNRYLGQ